MSREQIIGELEALAREGRGIAKLHALRLLLALPDNAAEEERDEVDPFAELDAYRFGHDPQ